MFVQRFSFGDWNCRECIQTDFAYFLAFEIIHWCHCLLKVGMVYCKSKIWNTWADTDPRKEGSILQVGKIEQGTADYKGDKVS
jgi:hypothetical protein